MKQKIPYNFRLEDLLGWIFYDNIVTYLEQLIEVPLSAKKQEKIYPQFSMNELEKK